MTGQIAGLAKAFASANVEMMALKLPEATVVEASPAALRRLNCRADDIVGRQLAKYGTGQLSARHVAADDGAQKIEVCYAPPLGNARTIQFATQSWDDGGQHHLLLIGQHGNAQAAEEAIQNEHRLQLALRSGGYALWDHDYRNNESFGSPAMYELLGFEPDAPELSFTTFNERVHPEDRAKTLNVKIRDAQFGEDLFQSTYRVKNRAGEYIWIESIAGVMRDLVDARPVKAVGLCRDVSEQMNALERVRISERNMKRSQAAAKLGSFVYKIDQNTSRLSTEMLTLLRIDPANAAGAHDALIAMMDADSRARFTEFFEFARLGQKSPAFEITVRLAAGEVQHFNCSIEPERNSHGEVDVLFGTCQCITERKTLERKFLQAQKMEAVGQLTGGLAHDFNNLLMVVLGNLQLVEQSVKGDAKALKRIQAAMDATDRSTELTKRLLAFSRQQTLQNREVTVNDLVTGMGGILQQAIGGTVELKLIPGTEVWSIKADPTQLETAILNLSINARDAMKPKGGTLIIETQNSILDAVYCTENEDVLPGDYVQISVTDTGCGIAPENIEKVFQPFFTTKGPEAGSGLGLSMIYGFVKQSGGHVKIYSEVGHGTSVKIFLPRDKAGVKAASVPMDIPVMQAAAAPQPEPAMVFTQAPAPAPEPQPPKPLVLVVEDNESVREVAAAMIEEMGFDVLQASNGTDGLKSIDDRRDIALVLSDVIMAGGMNGPEMVSLALKLRPDLKVLFMSGYAPGSVRQMNDLPESIELVAKPFTRADLTDKVKRAVAA